jgi:phosphoglycolate phosphatase-like HAD superfamily hydrolase
MAKSKSIRLLVTDLDNTLYDWLSSFVPAFYAMVDIAADKLLVDREQLLSELKSVHQRYHNSEQPFALLETPTVQKNFPGASRLERKHLLEEAFVAFGNTRKQHLRLYPGVLETIRTIKGRGCVVVGHTEAVVENSLYRLKLLGLTSELEALYAPASRAEGHPDPSRLGIHEEFEGFVNLLPSHHRKPDPSVLLDICSYHKVSVDHTLYVGDSMTRDIAMAKMAGATAAWARYGSKYDPALWEKLVRVTHWTDEDVMREKRLREEYRDVHPDVEIDSFSELPKLFEFEGGR